MTNSFSLINRNIVVTGASSGIGKQCAISCSQMGANVILLDRNEQKLKETFDILEEGNHSFYSLDLTNFSDIEPVIKEVVSKIGKISGLIHSAGIGMTLPLKLLTPTHYNKVININVIAGLELVRILSKKKYLDNVGASYVLIASVMSIVGDIGNVAYCLSKGALVPATKALALELAKKNIRVNCVSPGVIETEMAIELFKTISIEAKELLIKKHPLGLGRVTDVAYACIFLLADASKWVTGTNLIVDGGYCAQ